MGINSWRYPAVKEKGVTSQIFPVTAWKMISENRDPNSKNQKKEIANGISVVVIIIII
jgi:hypothetical protein